MAKKVLIFGSKGMLAYDLALVFKHKGYVVIGEDIGTCDITDAQAVTRSLRRHRPNLVINTAVRQNLDACERDPDGTFRVNALGSFYIASAAAALDIPVVQMSTIYVFDGEKRTPYIETDRPNPINVYGVTKLASEGFVKAANPRHYIVRTNFLFGVHYNKAMGGNGNFIQRMLILARESNTAKAVTDQIVSLTYTKDLAQAIARLVARGLYGTYHITNSGYAGLYEVARELFHSALPHIRVARARLADFTTRARRPKNTKVGSVFLRKAGVSTLRPWKKSLAAYLKELKRSGKI